MKVASSLDEMIETQIVSRGLSDEGILTALRSTPREVFVPTAHRSLAFADQALPIGGGQTISQPYMVAFAIEAAGIGPADRVLDVGSGSGYQSAVVSYLAKEVVGVELKQELVDQSKEKLSQLSRKNVQIHQSDARDLTPDKLGEFDVILCAAAAEKLPESFLKLLKIGGRIVIPLQKQEKDYQELTLVRKTSEGVQMESLLPCRYVPLV